MTLLERLRWARKAAGLSEGQASKVLGFPGPVDLFESGTLPLTEDELKKIAFIYGVDREWLTSGQERELDADCQRVLAGMKSAFQRNKVRDLLARLG